MPGDTMSKSHFKKKILYINLYSAYWCVHFYANYKFLEGKGLETRIKIGAYIHGVLIFNGRLLS